MNVKTKLLLALIILLAAALRFYKLDSNPPSLYWDEISNGYDAYSILKTGRDQYGQLLPLVFRGLDDYRPGVYIYTTIPAILIFGLNEFSVRLPSALFGTLSVLVTFLIVKKLFSKKLALISALLLAISPWQIQFSRAGFEANLMQSFILLAIFFFLHSRNKPSLIFISSFFFGLALNTYQAAKIWIPSLLLTIIFFWRNEIYRLGKKIIAVSILILCIFSLPIILNPQEALLRGRAESIFKESKNPMNDFISAYLSYFSPKFLFSRGDTIGRHSITGMGELYVFEAPIILFGLYVLIHHNSRRNKFILAYFLLAPIAAAFAKPSPHALRSITFIPVWSLLGAIGLLKIKKMIYLSYFRVLIMIIFCTLIFYNVSTYLHLYYKHYPIEKGPDWQVGYKEMVQVLKKYEANYHRIIISPHLGNPYLYVLFYSKYDPSKYQKEKNSLGFGKYIFAQDFEKYIEGKTLVFGKPYEGHDRKFFELIYSPSKVEQFSVFETQ